MPDWVAEYDWARAKEIARRQGQENNFAYIMGIYNRIARRMRRDELEIGKKVEREHTQDEKKAEKIAKDHLKESKDYYTRLLVMEKHAKEDRKMSPERGKIMKWLLSGKINSKTDIEKLQDESGNLLDEIIRLAKERAEYSGRKNV